MFNVAEQLKIRIAEDKKMDISRATHGPTEPKLESLEEATMVVLNESPMGQQEDFSNFGKGMAGSFKTDFSDAVDDFLHKVSDARRKIKEMAKAIKERVSKMKEDGYLGKYKKETIAAANKILEGCEDMQSGHYHLLSANHHEMLLKMNHKI